MTTINVTINRGSKFGNAVTQIEVWNESGRVGRWELQLDNNSGASHSSQKLLLNQLAPFEAFDSFLSR
jgi:hypothetical protein